MKNEKSKFCKTKNQKVKNQKPKNCETKNRRARPSYFAISDQSHNCPVSCRTCCCQGVSHALLVFDKKNKQAKISNKCAECCCPSSAIWVGAHYLQSFCWPTWAVTAGIWRLGWQRKWQLLRRLFAWRPILKWSKIFLIMLLKLAFYAPSNSQPKKLREARKMRKKKAKIMLRLCSSQNNATLVPENTLSYFK